MNNKEIINKTLDDLWNEQFEKFIVGESAYGYGDNCAGEAGKFMRASVGLRQPLNDTPVGNASPEDTGASTIGSFLGKTNSFELFNVEQFTNQLNEIATQWYEQPYIPSSPIDPFYNPAAPMMVNQMSSIPMTSQFLYEFHQRNVVPSASMFTATLDRGGFTYLGYNVGVNFTLIEQPLNPDSFYGLGLGLQAGTNLFDSIGGALSDVARSFREISQNNENCEPEPDPNGATNPNQKGTPGTDGLPNDPTPTPVNPVRPGGPINIGGPGGAGVFNKEPPSRFTIKF